jgi:hypothetical protein
MRRRAVSTSVLNNPVPRNATENSLSLLKFIGECKSDEVVRSKPITIYLNRKWNAFAYRFYLLQIFVFMMMMGSTSFITTYAPDSDDISNLNDNSTDSTDPSASTG